MSADRNLLELAAKAAGYVLRTDMHIPSGGIWIIKPNGDDQCWDPLNDDGDALRLAVQLGLFVDTKNYDRTLVGYPTGPGRRKFADVQVEHCDAPCAATRRAIVRAAAAIGGGLK